MRVNITEAGVELALSQKIIDLCNMISKDNETVTIGEFVRVLNIMEFNDWNRFDQVIDSIIEKKPKYKGVEGLAKTHEKPGSPLTVDTVSVSAEDRSKPKKVKKTTKKTSKKVASKKVEKPVKKARTYNHSKLSGDEITQMVQNYIDSVTEYSISKMAKDLGIGETTARRHALLIDPDGSKIAPNRRNNKAPKANTILNYITLNDDESERKAWLDKTVAQYAKENKMSKVAVMSPIYTSLRNNYGIVFSQLGKDYLYAHNFNPIEDYPIPTSYELLYLDNGIFSTAKAILMDTYETA